LWKGEATDAKFASPPNLCPFPRSEGKDSHTITSFRGFSPAHPKGGRMSRSDRKGAVVARRGLFLKYEPEYIVDLARQMRVTMTPAEELLWSAIRRRQMDNLRFRKQHPIGRYIADFCCPERKLIIELDGNVHDDRKEYDKNRDEYLRGCGYRIVRFSNDDVLSRLEKKMKSLCDIANEIAP
jgi:very-short-patch-repair endonuclease